MRYVIILIKLSCMYELATSPTS